MKFLSVSVLFIALTWSYLEISKLEKITETDLINLENQLKQNISDLIKEKGYFDLAFNKFRTNLSKDNTATVYFSYNFKDEKYNKILLEGRAILKNTHNKKKVKHWSLKDISIDKNYINFFKELTIETRINKKGEE